MNQPFAIYRVGSFTPIGTVAADSAPEAKALAGAMWGGAMLFAVPTLGLTVAEAVADDRDRDAAGLLRIMRQIRKAA